MSSKNTKQPINFRLGQLHVRRLEEQGSQLGLSRHEFARYLVTQSLEGTAEKEARDELDCIRKDLYKTRRELRDVLELLLLKLDPEVEPHDVRQYIIDELGQL